MTNEEQQQPKKRGRPRKNGIKAGTTKVSSELDELKKGLEDLTDIVKGLTTVIVNIKEEQKEIKEHHTNFDDDFQTTSTQKLPKRKMEFVDLPDECEAEREFDMEDAKKRRRSSRRAPARLFKFVCAGCHKQKEVPFGHRPPRVDAQDSEPRYYCNDCIITKRGR